MSDLRTATEQMEADWKRARESYDKDSRFRMLAMSCVSRVMSDHGPVDPERADREAHDIALAATALLLQRIYEDDAELRATREERDRYKQLAEKAFLVSPITPIFLKDPLVVPQDGGSGS
jgi:hypothetical protein